MRERDTSGDRAGGVYRRQIEIISQGRAVVADLEDDFHRFRLRLEHDGVHVVAALGEAHRFPWTSCPGALAPLERLRGLPLSRSLLAPTRHTDPRAQCTHLLDLAALAVAQAAAGRERRRYAVAIPDRVEGRTRAELERDGVACLHFELDGNSIRAPEPFAGRALFRSAFAHWADSELEPDAGEAALVLARACAISLGRGIELDRFARASDVGGSVVGSCHTFQPAIAAGAERVRASTRDFSRRPERLLAPEWTRPPAALKGDR